MTEIDALKYELEQQEKSFNKLHKMYVSLLKQQGELEKENEQLKEEIQFLFNQIKAFREDCRIYQDFEGASTLNRLIEILEQSKEIFE